MTTFKTYLNNEREKAIQTKREEFASWLQGEMIESARKGYGGMFYYIENLPEEFKVTIADDLREETERYLNEKASGCEVKIAHGFIKGDRLTVNWRDEPEEAEDESRDEE